MSLLREQFSSKNKHIQLNGQQVVLVWDSEGEENEKNRRLWRCRGNENKNSVNREKKQLHSLNGYDINQNCDFYYYLILLLLPVKIA